MRLHRLERPEPWSDRWGEVNWYPDYQRVIDRLSTFTGMPASRLVVGMGIEGLIRDLVMLCCDPGDGLAFTSPTCAMFGLYADIFGARRVEIITDPDRPPDAWSICTALTQDVRLLILPNPGQPVETLFELADLRRIARRCRDINAVFAIDEAYYGFGAPTALPLIDEFENVVVLRTFSKAFGGAALRVGYAMGSCEVTKPLDACRQSGEIAGLSLDMAIDMMNRWGDVIAPGIQDIIDGRDWLRERLTADGFKVRGSHANHVLIDMASAGKAARVHSALAQRGIRVRTNAPPVDRHLLVTCGSRELMERFYTEFQKETPQ